MSDTIDRYSAVEAMKALRAKDTSQAALLAALKERGWK